LKILHARKIPCYKLMSFPNALYIYIGQTLIYHILATESIAFSYINRFAEIASLLKFQIFTYKVFE